MAAYNSFLREPTIGRRRILSIKQKDAAMCVFLINYTNNLFVVCLLAEIERLLQKALQLGDVGAGNHFQYH